jgi:alkanesulfonate monooxygenase SsuD/methylene tetrahydromethanopterin reductase-like flavin-dependent oxidoreductase (luciferase family)
VQHGIVFYRPANFAANYRGMTGDCPGFRGIGAIGQTAAAMARQPGVACTEAGARSRYVATSLRRWLHRPTATDVRDTAACDWKAAMRVSTTIRFSPGKEPHDRLLSRVADYARRIEASGFPGIWVGDSLGRGRPTLDPLIELSVLAAVTDRVELGISVLQLPLRHPIELAHRVQSVQALSGNRLRLGVGSGSTRADFELLGYDYDHRFGIMKRSLETMRRAWRGEPVNAGGALSLWPGCEGGPPILMGAWRSPRWITFAAQECQGWTPSGRFSSWNDLEHGMRIYREAGGGNAVLANVAIDLANRPESAGLTEVATSLVCPPDEARRRLKRIEQLGFDEVLLVSPANRLEDIERARDFL